MKLKAACFFCIRKLWQISAVILVLLAVGVSVLKYTLPYANDYKSTLEEYLDAKYDISLSIGAISASWQGSGPALVLENLSFKDNQTAPISLTISNVSFELNIWESIKAQQVRSNYFVINGFHTTFKVSRLFSQNQRGVSFEQKELIEELFLGDIGHFAIEDSSINFILANNTERKLLLKNIAWRNSSTQHLGSGRLALPGISVGSFDARIALQGKTLEQMVGDIFVKANQVDVSNWLEQYMTTNKQHLHSDINLQAWLQIKQGWVDDVTIQWLPSQVKWGKNNQQHHISLSEGGIHLYPEQGAWRLKSTGLVFSNNKKEWPSLQFEALLADQHKIWLQQVDLALLNDLFKLTSFTHLDPLLARQPSGQIEHAYFTFDKKQQWQLWFNSKNIGWQEKNAIPAAQSLRINGLINQQRGRITVFSENDTLMTGAAFSHDIDYNQINLDLDVVKQDNIWHLSSNSLWFDNDHITVSGEMQLSLSDTPRLDLYAEVFAPDASIAGRYFPLPLMSPDLVSYLNTAIKAGEITKAQVLFSGPLSGFPFDDGSGQFDVLAQINNATYQFDPAWPAVSDADLSLHFANKRMDIHSQQGMLINLDIGQSVHVSIDNLMQADEVIVKITKQAQLEKMHDFFRATPLANPLAEIFNVVQGKGVVNTDIELLIGSKFNGGASVSGTVDFNDSFVNITAPGIMLEKLRGNLYFKNEKVTLTNATASWLGMPLSFNYTSDNNAENYRAAIDISAQLNVDTLIDSSLGLLKGYLSGKSDVDIGLDLNFTEQGYNYRAQVNTPLIGVSSFFPDAYSKKSTQTWPLNAVVQGDEISNLITANIDNKFYVNGILENTQSQLTNIHFIIGNKDLGLNKQGLAVTIAPTELDFLPWVDFIAQVISTSKHDEGTSSSSIMPPLNEVIANINKMTVSNAQFNDLEMRLTPTDNALYLRLNAKELRAEAFIPTINESVPIRINSDYLRLNFIEADTLNLKDNLTTPDHSWLAGLPAIEFECGDCKVSAYQLDKVSASLLGDGEKLLISELVVNKGDHILRTKGQWQNGLSAFEGALTSDNIGNLFNEFDITTAIKDSKANINYKLNWQGAPYDVDIATLTGNIEWRLGEGYLTEVSDGGARVFSLLSLDSLVRKLKLDFRDVFSKGFFYNKMQGTMQLDKGIAYTKDTKMDGVPADLSIKGYANLNTRDIEYDLAVAPQVTSSIPVIVAWMVNPVTGLAALAIDKVIHSARVISEINFKITGKMDNPQVQELDRKSREVTLPQAAQNQPQKVASTPAFSDAR